MDATEAKAGLYKEERPGPGKCDAGDTRDESVGLPSRRAPHRARLASSRTADRGAHACCVQPSGPGCGDGPDEHAPRVGEHIAVSFQLS